MTDANPEQTDDSPTDSNESSPLLGSTTRRTYLSLVGAGFGAMAGAETEAVSATEEPTVQAAATPGGAAAATSAAGVGVQAVNAVGYGAGGYGEGPYGGESVDGFTLGTLEVVNERANEAQAQNIPDGEAVQGETVTVEATLTNGGSTADSTDVEFDFAGMVTETITVSNLNAGASTTVFVELQVGTVDPGQYDHQFSVVGTSETVSDTLTVRELGDVNHDGNVGSGDATRTQRVLVGLGLAQDAVYNPAAVDLSRTGGDPGSGDVTRLQQVNVGLFDPKAGLNINTDVVASGFR